MILGQSLMTQARPARLDAIEMGGIFREGVCAVNLDKHCKFTTG
jgi:hypothetical protein